MEINLDLKNYTSKARVFKRTASRAVIRCGENYLLIHSKYGDYKFPGGGVESGEILEEALIREVQEETGYTVIQDSMSYLGVVHERRKGDIDDVMEMDSHYFTCKVKSIAGERCLDEYEEEYEFRAIWIPLEEAIAQNRKGINLVACPWVMRDTKVMEKLIDNV